MAAWGLAFVGDKGADALKQAAKSDSSQIRASVIAALGEQIQKSNDHESRNIVKLALYDSSEEVQVEAIKLLDLFEEDEFSMNQILDKLSNKIKPKSGLAPGK